jgi:hypothetical protein
VARRISLRLPSFPLLNSEAIVVRNIDLYRFQDVLARRCLKLLLAGLALACMMSAPRHLLAQTTGTLTGVVKDTSGGIIPGAKITLTNTSDKSLRSTVSSGNAFFSFAAVQPATYNLTVSYKGFETFVVTGIDMHPGDSKTIDTIALKVGAVAETVTVTSTTAGVELDSPEKSYLITDEDIKRLSTVGRDVSELIRILPGFAVAASGSTGGINNDSTNNASQVAGFSSSSIASYAANGAAPGAGAVAVLSDGANTTDPADSTSSIGNVNMEMVAEVKVRTSAFGADSANGPVVLDAVSKSGGSHFHGSIYGNARNSALNSNDWIDNYFNNPRAGTYNYFPGANIGGPVIIPHTNFNRSKKLIFFTAMEVYDQRNLYGNTATLSFIPTARMLGGDLSTDSIESALNLPTGASAALCPTPYQCVGLNNFGAGYSPQSTQVDVQGHNIINGQIPLADFSPNVSAFTRFYPKINRVPQPQGGPPDCTNAADVLNQVTGVSLLGPGQLCSDNINYDANIFAQHNGYQYHARVDQNFTEDTKLYVTYDYEHVSDQSPVTNTYYAGSAQNIIPSPVGALTYASSQRLSVNNTHVFGPTLTNELVFAGVYYFSPAQLQNTSLLQDANTGFVGPRYYENGDTQLPQIINYQGGVPDFGMGYFDPSRGAPKRKFSVNGADNLTKQLQSHSIKVGVYAEQSANNEYVANYNDPQGQLNYNQYLSCNVYDYTNTNSPLTSELGNSVGDFLTGCSGFSQVNRFQSGDMKFTTLDAYGTDEWKATKKLTVTYGIRFDHLGPWVDSHGNGLAVWEPEKIDQHVVYSLDPNDPTTWPGIAWHNGKGSTLDASLPLSGSPSRAIFYSPRAGIAYDLYGNGKTTFRGGWGAYRYHDSYYTSDGPLLTSLGVSVYRIPTNVGCTLDQIGNSGRISAGQPTVTLGSGPFVNPTGQTCGGFTTTPFQIAAADRKDSEQPVTYSYNFTADQQMGRGSLLEISYVGNQTQHSLTGGDGIDKDTSNQNAIQLGGLYQPDPNTSSPNFGVVAPASYIDVGFYNVQDWRPYPNYSGVYVENHIAYSNYNALQISLNKQSGAFTYNLNYTWSKALGIRGTGGNGSVGDSLNLRNNYGLLPYNRKQVANFTFSYQEGTKYHGNKIVGGFLNLWEIAGITTLESGPDVAAFNSNFSLSGGYEYQPAGTSTIIGQNFDGITQLGTPDVNVQPVLTCDPRENLPGVEHGAKSFINGKCFTLPAPGTNGSFNLPDIHGPMYFNSDLTLIKNFHLKEGQGLQFKLAGFNYLNHPNWQLYGGPAEGLGLGYGQNLSRGSNGQISYPTSDAAARAALVLTSTNFGSTPYKSSLRIVEVSVKYSF